MSSNPPPAAQGQAPQRSPEDPLTDLVMRCALAVLAGAPTVTVSVGAKRPMGMPRGELLSVGSDGSRNYACHPVRVLDWLHGLTSSQPSRADTQGPAVKPVQGVS